MVITATRQHSNSVLEYDEHAHHCLTANVMLNALKKNQAEDVRGNGRSHRPSQFIWNTIVCHPTQMD